MRDDAAYIRDGIRKVESHLRRDIRFTYLSARVGAAKTLFASRVLKLVNERKLTSKEATEILRLLKDIGGKVADKDFIEKIIPKVRQKEKAINPNELRGNAPLALIYIYGYWYPFELVDEVRT